MTGRRSAFEDRHPASIRRVASWLALVLALWLPPFAESAWAGQRVDIIIAADSPAWHMDKSRLRDIFLKKLYIDPQGHTLIPVNLPVESPLRQAFTHSLIGMDDAQLRDYWNRRYFQGQSPPYVLGSQNAVVQFVAKTPGAIGYVLPCNVTADVRVILELTLTGTGKDDCKTTAPAPIP